MKKILDKILVVEDEAFTRVLIVRVLRNAGYRVLEAGDGVAALRLIEEEKPAMAVMDVNMPEMGGLAALAAARTRGLRIPILMLSGQGEVDDRLTGLGLGADDYMAKPFDTRELLARVTALLRRGRDHLATGVRRLQHGDLVIDLAAKHAARAGVRLPLTATEFAILDVLASSAGHPVSRERMLDLVWGYTYTPKTRTVETHIWRLRKKLGENGSEGGLIRNLPGLGYVLASENDGDALAPGSPALVSKANNEPV